MLSKKTKMALILLGSVCLLTTSCSKKEKPSFSTPPPATVVVKSSDYSPLRDAIKFIGLCLLAAAVVKAVGSIIETSNKNNES